MFLPRWIRGRIFVNGRIEMRSIFFIIVIGIYVGTFRDLKIGEKKLRKRIMMVVWETGLRSWNGGCWLGRRSLSNR